MESNIQKLCKNKITNQDELYEIIKFFYAEYKMNKESTQNNKLLLDMFIFILYNIDIITDKDFKKYLKGKVSDLLIENKSEQPKEYEELQSVLNKIRELL